MRFKHIQNKPIKIKKGLWVQFFNISDSSKELAYEQTHKGYPMPFNPKSHKQIVTFDIATKPFLKDGGKSICNGEILCDVDNKKSPLTFYDNSYDDSDTEIRGRQKPNVVDIILGLEGVYDVLYKWVKNAKTNGREY